MKTYAKLVFVDFSKLDALPAEVRNAVNSAGGSVPQLVFMSPDNQKTYASFNHASLKGQDYGKIFRDVKKSIRDAKKTGELKQSGIVSISDEPPLKSETSGKTEVIIQDPEILSWHSTVGSEVDAKLIKVKNNIYYLKLANGKTIPVKAIDLHPDTLKMAEKLIEANRD